MSTQICSFCLADERKMILLENIEWRRVLLKLMSIESDIEPDLSPLELSVPEALCFMCHWQLQRCRRFVRAARRSNHVLNDIYSQGLPVTKEILSELNIKTIQNFTIHTKVTSISPDTEELLTHITVKQESIDFDASPGVPYDLNAAEENDDIAKLEDKSFVDDYDDDTKPPKLDQEYIYCETKNNNVKSKRLKKPKKQCKLCKKNYSRKDHVNHECVKNKTKKTDEDLICNICNRTFSDKYVLKKHQRIHSGEKPYICEKCNRAFLLPTYLKDHILRTHAESKEFSCSECPKTFSTKNTLLKHIKRLHSGKTYTCDRCAKSFHNNSDLTSHMVVHSAERPHVCARCGKAFKRKNQLNEHAKSHNDAKVPATEKVFGCTHCDKKYSLRASLFNHMKVHTGMLYTCDRCAVSCRDRSTLRVHMLVHGSARPHACSACDKRFKRRSQLTEHVRTHSGARPHACDMCDKTFTQKGSLNFHKRVHSGVRPFVCEVCGRTFDSKYNLAKHLRVHTGERPYPCVTCARRFTHAASLHDHARRAHGGPRLRCDTCGKTFVHKNTLKKHMKIHHTEK